MSQPIPCPPLIHAPFIFAIRLPAQAMRLTDFSDNIEQLTGYSATTFQQKPFVSLIHTDDLTVLQTQLNKISTKENTIHVLPDYRVLNADKQWCWVSETLVITADLIHSYLSNITTRKLQELQAIQENNLLKAQNNLAPDGILVMNAEHKIISWNQRLLDLWDIPATLFDLNDNNEIMEVIKSKVNDPEGFIEDINELRKPNSPDEINNEIGLRSGITLERYSKAIFSQNNSYQGRVWFMHDITHRKLEEQTLRDSEQLFSLAIKAANDGLWAWDFQSDSIWFSPHWKEQLGYDDTNLSNSFTSWQRVIFAKDYKIILDKVRDFIAGRANKFELIQRFIHKKGHTVHIRNCAVCENDEHGNVVRIVGAHTDITRQRTIEQELKALTLTDALTQLHNQHSFIQQLRLQISRSKRYKIPLSLILIDIDHFHAFNVKYGYHVGDDILIKIAEILKELSRDVDVCGRYGGEEFALLLPETDIKGSMTLIKRLQSAFQQVIFDGQSITTSFGLCTWDAERINDIEAFIKITDQALHRAKAQGRNCIVVG